MDKPLYPQPFPPRRRWEREPKRRRSLGIEGFYDLPLPLNAPAPAAWLMRLRYELFAAHGIVFAAFSIISIC